MAASCCWERCRWMRGRETWRVMPNVRRSNVNGLTLAVAIVAPAVSVNTLLVRVARGGWERKEVGEGSQAPTTTSNRRGGLTDTEPIGFLLARADCAKLRDHRLRRGL